MKRSTRLLWTLGVCELLLAAIWLWLLNGLSTGSLQSTGNAAETAASLSSILGGIMGALAALILVVVVILRRKGS